MQFIQQILNATKSCAKRKGENSNAVVAIITASITALFSWGFISGFGGNVGSFMLRSIGNPTPSENFINEKTRIPLVDLDGDWQFAVGDDRDRAQPDFDDSSWAQIKVPSQWENEGYKDYDGYAWYRRSFSIDVEDTNRPIYAYMGQIDDVDEVFINGHLIGGHGHFPPNFATAWNRNRLYRVPEGVVHAGIDNVIAVRVYDDQIGGGIHRGKIGLYTTELPQPIIDLSGSWKLKTGDDPRWKDADFDESGFKRIQVPMAWDNEGYQNYDGYAWYRKSFGPLPVSKSETLVVILGKIDDTDEVYLNGELIGQTGKIDNSDRDEYDSYHRINRAYEFPSSLLRNGNLLSVRVHDSQAQGGIYSGPVGIMAKEDYALFQAQLEEAGKWHLSDTIDWLLGRK